MRYTEVADSLVAQLNLKLPPIALAFVAERPPDVPPIGNVAPSSCALWRRAETDVFYAPAEAHFNCPLGAMVMGFPLPEAQMQQLQEAVQMMCGLSYVSEEEVDRVPKIPSPSAGIVYGPLGRFPLAPDAALLWVTPQQGMMLSECCGLVNWAASPSGMLGRPGCASIPAALAAGKTAHSFGCIGMRINTGISEEFFLMVVPGELLQTLARDVAHTYAVNQQLEAYYRDRAAKLQRVSPN